MATFFGRNNTAKTNEFYYDRLRFKLNAYKDVPELVMRGVKDFSFSEYVYYGKIDLFGDPIIPYQRGIKHISDNSGGDTIGLIKPVAECLTDLLSYFNECIIKGKLKPDDPIVSSLKMVAGYQNPLSEYNLYMSKMMNVFEKKFIMNKKSKIKTFDNFLNEFLVFSKKMQNSYPTTFTGWYRSKNATPFCSGLFINLCDISLENDSEKEKFVLSDSFSFYLNACQRHGFFISKHNPNILTVNFESAAFKEKLSNYVITSTNAFFDTFFFRVIDNDLEILNDVLAKSYQNFINLYPNARSFEFGKNGHMFSKIEKRETNNKDNILNYNKIIKVYTILRNNEEKNPFSVEETNNIIKDATFLLKKVDKFKAIDYINNRFKPIYANKEGSVNWFKKKEKNRKKQNEDEKTGGY